MDDPDYCRDRVGKYVDHCRERDHWTKSWVTSLEDHRTAWNDSAGQEVFRRHLDVLMETATHGRECLQSHRGCLQTVASGLVESLPTRRGVEADLQNSYDQRVEADSQIAGAAGSCRDAEHLVDVAMSAASAAESQVAGL